MEYVEDNALNIYNSIKNRYKNEREDYMFEKSVIKYKKSFPYWLKWFLGI